MLKLTIASLIVSWATLAGGCVSQRSDPDYGKKANVWLEEADEKRLMRRQANKVFPEVNTAEERAFASGAKLTAEKPLQRIAPIYPAAQRGTNKRGMVWVAFVVDEQGDVAEAQALSVEGVKLEPEFTTAALEAVKQWKFTAATVDGKPVKRLQCLLIVVAENENKFFQGDF